MGKGTCFFRSSGLGISALGSLRSRLVPEWIWGFIGQRGSEAGGQNLRWKESLGLAQGAGSATEMMFYHSSRLRSSGPGLRGDISQPQRHF